MPLARSSTMALQYSVGNDGAPFPLEFGHAALSDGKFRVLAQSLLTNAASLGHHQNTEANLCATPRCADASPAGPRSPPQARLY
jgi:hypothetical protein